MKIKAILFILWVVGLIPYGKISEKTQNQKEVQIQWVDDLAGDFSFQEIWSYPEGIFRNEFGQLVCDGICPPETENMKDEEGKIFTDSLLPYYKLIDTTHLFHSIHSEANAYEWAGTNFIKAKRINNDTIICFTHNNVSTHSSLNLILTQNTVAPTIILESITLPDEKKIFNCIGGEMIIDKKLWKTGILKATFDFHFNDSKNPNKPMYWKGKIYAKIEM